MAKPKSAPSPKKLVKSKLKKSPSKHTARQKDFINQEGIIAALQAAKMGVWEWDFNTNRVIWSNETYHIFGLPVGNPERTYEGYMEQIHPDDREELTKVIEHAVQQAGSYLIEHRVIWPNGEIHWLHSTGNIIKDKKGKLSKMTGTVHDITQQKNSEDQKKQIEITNKTLFESSPDAIFVMGLNSDDFGKMISANESAARMHGYTMEEFLALNIRDIDTPEDFKRTGERVIRLVHGERFTFELNHIRKDKSRFPVEVSAGVFEINGRKFMLAIDRDITDRKAVEEALRESEQRFRTLQEASFGGIAIHDQGKIIDANQGLSRLMGYSLKELRSMNGMLLLPEEERDFVMTKIKSGYELPYDSQGLRKDGTRFHMEIHGSNIPYKGKIMRITEFRDITGRKHAEEQIREQNSRLQAIAQSLRRKNEQLEEFTQIVSHNLRSPVGNINSLIELMENTDKTEDFLQFISLLKQSGRSLLTTLDELNEVLQIKQNRSIEKQEVVFAEVFLKVRNMLIAHIGEINASVTYDFSKAPTISYPNIYLESILLNLLSNALKYHHPEKTPVIHFQTSKEGADLLLEVSDNGLGINLEKHGHQVFKLHKTFHKHPESKGIGLFMIKNQIETMGGEINIKSKEGKGTTFQICFFKNQAELRAQDVQI